jgi:hypothetical protein
MPVPDEPLRKDHTELRRRVLTEDVARHDAVKRCRAALGRAPSENIADLAGDFVNWSARVAI